jgi:lipopolysaccharide biosynthesis protein
MYGIYGFCFYYYWFSGERIMEKPINNWLNDKTLDFPFMLFWANADWTNTWGENADIGTKIYDSRTKSSDVEKFVDDIIPFFRDERYIRVNGRPHLIIYRTEEDPYLPIFIRKVSQLIEKREGEKPFISLVFPFKSPENFDPRKFGADAAVEFGLFIKNRQVFIPCPVKSKLMINPLARLKIHEATKSIENEKFSCPTDYPTFRGAMTTFDNTARKIYTSAVMYSISPNLYQKWLSKLIKTSSLDYIFLSAWNEWAEGMHLEPDQRFGYAYLQATKNALEENL